MKPRRAVLDRVFALASTLGLALAAATLSLAPASAITGGRAVDGNDGLRESLVRIESADGELCTGVLVRDDIVLTAAHCVLDEVGFRVYVLDFGFRSASVPVSALALHPSFRADVPPRRQPGVDLALLKLDRRLGLDFRPLDYARARLPASGEIATIGGFGTTRYLSKSSARTLRVADIVVIQGLRVGNGVVMVADPALLGESEGSGACQGDSGGPLLSGGPGGYRLDGIVSWSSGAFSDTRGAACGGLTAITPLAPHVSWINRRIRDLDRAVPSGRLAPMDITPPPGAYTQGQ